MAHINKSKDKKINVMIFNREHGFGNESPPTGGRAGGVIGLRKSMTS